jgi:two-component system, NtrC family, sensor kinase
MKILFSLLIFALSSGKCTAQEDTSFSFVTGRVLGHEQDRKLYELWYQGEIRTTHAPDSAFLYAQQGIILAKKLRFQEGEGLCLLTLAKVFMNIGNYSKALETAFQSLAILEKLNIQSEISINLYFIGQIFNLQGDYRQSLSYNFRAKSIAETMGAKQTLVKILANAGLAYEKLNQLDSALFYARQSYRLCDPAKDNFVIAGSANLVGEVCRVSGNLGEAMSFYRLSVLYADKVSDYLTISEARLGIAKVFERKNNADSCLYYGKQSFTIGRSGGFVLQVLNACTFLSDYYRAKGEFDSAYVYQQLGISAKDSIFSLQKIMQFQNISFSEQMRQQEIKEAEIRYRNKISIYILVGVVAAILFVAIILWRGNRQKQKANILLNKQKAEIEFQKTKAENALDELKSAQAQLIQSEKMASLGELTAGIAHEMQNPLNFVNNFSEINKELLAEMKEAIKKGNIVELGAIADDITDNEEKIIQHGRRASAIVKGMLQHSRRSTGKQEPTDINALADEYFLLAFHGFRAKDSSFKAITHTDFDYHIGKISIVPQDIGRVLLNLYNNAFYAVTEKRKNFRGEYEPTVFVSTKTAANKVYISVKDNGNGIPQKIQDKVFQPFFTTKPTGQGTGLGLSLSYDIIKAHGGKIKMSSIEGENTIFTLELPWAEASGAGPNSTRG